MPLLTNSKVFPFRSFAGKEPTTTELQTELEKVYQYLAKSIQNLSLNSFGGALDAGSINSVSADSIIGQINATNIGSINAANIVGQIAASQIGAVNATSITGVINSTQIGSINASSITGVIVTNQLADQILNTQRLMGSDLSVIRRVSVNPTLPNAAFPVDSLIINTVNKTLYQNVANVWQVVTASSNVVGTLTANDIGSVNANTIIGLIIASQISTVNASSVVGTITAAQIGSVNASSITGTITSTQIGSINAATITIGLLQSSQINTITAGQLTAGTISAQAIIVSGGSSGYFQSSNFVAGVSGWRLDGSGLIQALTASIGGFDTGADYIRDTGNNFGLASTVTAGDDVRFWAGSTFASRNSAPFRLTESGLMLCTGGTLAGTTVATTILASSVSASVAFTGNLTGNVTSSGSNTLPTIVATTISASSSITLGGTIALTASSGNIGCTGLAASGLLSFGSIGSGSGSTTFNWTTPGGTGSQIQLGDSSARHIYLRRSSGGSLDLLLIDNSTLIGGLSAAAGNGANFFLRDSSGNDVVTFNANTAGGAPQFGVYVGGAPTATGYIVFTDSAGTARKLLVG